MSINDSSYKLLFSSPDVVRDLIMGFIPDDWLHSLDYTTLEKAPGLVAHYLPHLKYLLIEQNQYTDETLTTMRNLVAAIIRVEHPASSQALFDLIDVLNDWLVDNPELRRIFAIWIRAVVLRRSRHAVVLPKIDDLKELKMTLTARFETWAEEFEQRGIEKGLAQGIEKGMQAGIEQGLLKGEALALQRLLVKRFGPLPDRAVQQLESATTDQIDQWIDRVLDAQSLNDVLRAS